MSRELKLIIWKNLIIRKRHWLLTFCEFLSPVLLFLLVAWARAKTETQMERALPDGLNIQNTTSQYEPYNPDDIRLPVSSTYIWYAPQNEFTEDIIRRIQNKHQIMGQDLRGFPNSLKLQTALKSAVNLSVIAVNFHIKDEKNLNYDLTVHEPGLIWHTYKLSAPSDGLGSKYIHNSFLAMQMAINIAFLEASQKLHENQRLTDVVFNIQEFPNIIQDTDSEMKQLIIDCLPFVTLLSFIFLIPSVLKRVVEEKASGIKELMKMVGIKSWMLLLSWYIHALIVSLVSIIVIVILLKVPIMATKHTPIEHCDGSVLFVFLLLYCIAAISLSLLISTLFKSPSIALTVAITTWILIFSIPIEFSKHNSSWQVQMLLALSPNAAMAFGYSSLGQYEMKGSSLSWNNLFKSALGGVHNVTLGNVFVMLIFDSALFVFLANYIDNINPGPYGIAQPFMYPISSLVGFIKRIFARKTQIDDEGVTSLQSGDRLNKCIEVINLKKRYGTKWVVEDVSFHVPNKRITVFLGHNGAGKTTTMSIITGMIQASGGAVLINGVNIKDRMNEVRRQLGLCPQHNLLFPDLTVSEHLQFFAMLKGATYAEAAKEASEMINTLNLADKQNSLPAQLSGGMKRKLCFGMAVVGNSPILILDEPTAGVDPESRRKLWNLLLEIRKTRTILISTHFMDEAEALADHIVIMGNGHKLCDGAPFELKKRYDTGYYLQIILREDSQMASEIVKDFKETFPDISFSKENGNQLVFKLPFTWKEDYPDFLEYLERHQNEWGIDNINLELTTLQDVFMKTREKTAPVDVVPKESRDFVPDITLKKMCTTLFYKRWLFLKNDPLIYLPAILIFVLMFSLVIFLSQPTKYNSDSFTNALPINLNVYGETGVYYSGANTSRLQDIKAYYKKEIISQDGTPIEVQNVIEAMLKAETENFAYFQKSMIIGANFIDNNGELTATALFSPSSVHSVPISVNMIMNAVAKKLLNESYSITTKNVPLQLHETATRNVGAVEFTLYWILTVPMAMIVLIGNFILFTHSEISTEFMQLQFTFGVPTWLYWLTNFIFDYFVFFIEISVILLIISIVEMTTTASLYGGPEFSIIFRIFLLHGLSAIPFAYLFGYRKTFAGGFSLHLIIGLACGIILTVLVLTLVQIPGYQTYVTVLKYLGGCFSPQFTLVYITSLFALKVAKDHNLESLPTDETTLCSIDGKTPTACPDNFFHDNLELTLLMVAPLIVYGLLLWFINSMIFKKMLKQITYFCKALYEKFARCDESGETKFQQLNDVPNDEKLLVANQLRKSYGLYKHHYAVKNVTIGIKEQECYGLLGVNGAGKSTTFRMLTKSEPCDNGDVQLIKNNKLLSGIEFHRNISYCPQNNALNCNLTGEQLLITVARLRGYDNKASIDVANLLLQEFELLPYKNQKCGTYSGGNLRKLSASLAFLGALQIILLDEPTAGVDPASRQQFWGTLLKFKSKFRRSFVLCSHSMEECEVLCDRISIMKDGEVACTGTLANLRKQYQKGYKLILKLNDNPNVKSVDEVDGEGDDTQSLISHNKRIAVVRTPTIVNIEDASFEEKIVSLKNDLENAETLKVTLKDEYGDFLHYHIDDKNNHLRLSQIFKEVKLLQIRHSSIEDYIITNASLEDIFLSVANQH